MVLRNIGFQGFSIQDLIYLSIGVFSAGCKPVLESYSYNILINNRNKYIEIIIEDKIVGKIYHGIQPKDVNEGIVLNDVRGQLYIHYMIHEGKSFEGYITEVPIDHRIFTGYYACLLTQGIDCIEAFRKVMSILSKGGGNPYRYFEIVSSEYEMLHRLYAALDRIMKNNNLLSNIIEKDKLIMGVRGLGDYVYVTTILQIDYGFTNTCIKPFNIKTYKEYEWVEKSTAFICGLSNEQVNFLREKYGSRTYQNEKGYLCILSNDPVRLVILLEKYHSFKEKH
jgi:hypothetical protein